MTISDTQYNFIVSQLNQIDRRLTSIETIMKPIVEDATILQRHASSIATIEENIKKINIDIASLRDEQEA